jgi:predicted O-methyltransferase YrrM
MSSLGEEFLSAVKPLYVPEMGTESTAHLLYWLVRSTRPRRVLEVGMGYTTPFLAKALRDNVDAVERERSALADPGGAEDHPMAYPDYYEKPYVPQLICIDRMTDRASSAPRALGVLERLGLSGLCGVIEGDLREAGARVRARFGLVDFAWVDTWDTLAFLREYWPMINPAGGLLAVHYLMTYPQGRAVQHYIRSLGAVDGGRLEITNLCEPHKFGQNSTTLVRRIRDYVEPDDLRPDGPANDPTGVLDNH